MHLNIEKYRDLLIRTLNQDAIKQVPVLAASMAEAWTKGSCIYFCGNGGSAGNAIHLANDFIYGAGINNEKGLRVESLSANPAVITCLANDIGYENIYSEQLRVKGNKDDILIALSGSGNSMNIVNAINQANDLDMKTFAILGFTGGKCKNIAQNVIHFDVEDMQISEDLQLIVGHMCMQWLYDQKIIFKK
jgi:D-sedoheptulose 7-phosphate isomerase